MPGCQPMSNRPWLLPQQASFIGPQLVNATNVPTHNRTISAMRRCTHPARVCQFPCSHNCETQICFSQNIPKKPSHVPDVCLSSNAETIDSSPRCLSFDWRRNYWLKSQSSILWRTQKLLTHVPSVCPSTVASTNDSRPRRLSSDRYRK